jgi:GTP-binding protein EngB required for normal cell division
MRTDPGIDPARHRDHVAHARLVAELSERFDGLDRMIAVLADRVPEERLAPARELTARASERIGLAREHTVVALAGATGSGKSSLFNALAGLEISVVGVRRPTTGVAHACIWGTEGTSALLDWLGIPPSRRVGRESVLDADDEADLRGLVLLDLPDHDSVNLSHRLEVDRLVAVVDLVIWVLDPQKYADAAVHDRYLSKLAGHSEVTVVLLNQADRLNEEELFACMADLRGLLKADGLGKVRLMDTSAVTREGLDQLRALLAEVVADRRIATSRLAVDLDVVLAELTPLVGEVAPEDVGRDSTRALIEELSTAAGVSTAGEVVEQSYLRRARAVSGWPFARWARLPVSPARMWADRVARAGFRPGGTAETGGPILNSDDYSIGIAPAIRVLVDRATEQLPDPWPARVRSAATSRLEALTAELEEVAESGDQAPARSARWRLAMVSQEACAAVVMAGLGWLIAGYLIRGIRIRTPTVAELPLPVLLALVGVVAGLLLAVVYRRVAAVTARRARERLESAMRERVNTLSKEYVIAPVRTELAAHASLRDAFLAASVPRLRPVLDSQPALSSQPVLGSHPVLGSQPVLD